MAAAAAAGTKVAAAVGPDGEVLGATVASIDVSCLAATDGCSGTTVGVAGCFCASDEKIN